LLNPESIRFKQESHLWQPRWHVPDEQPFRESIGGRIALVSEVNVAGKVLSRILERAIQRHVPATVTPKNALSWKVFE